MKLKKQYKIELAETLQSHWYSVHKISDVKIGAKYKKAGNSVTTEKFLGYFPSSTTILEAYPLSSFLVDWKVRQGATESDRILKEAGARGTNVHSGIEHLLGGGQLPNPGYFPGGRPWLTAPKGWHVEYKP